MSVKFKVIERGQPGVVGGGTKKFYAIPVPNDRITIRELASHISQMSSLSRTDVMAVLEALLESMPQLLSRGHSIQLGAFGTFRVSLSSSGEDSAEEVTASNITHSRMLFRPGKELRQTLQQLSFEKSS